MFSLRPLVSAVVASLALVLVTFSASAGTCAECNFLHACINAEQGGCYCEIKAFPAGSGTIAYCKAPGFCATIGPDWCPGDFGFPGELRTELPPCPSQEVNLLPLKSESPFKAKTAVPPPELGLNLVRRSITVPRYLVVELLASIELGKDQAQKEELEILVTFFDANDWQLSSDIHNATATLRDSEGTVQLGYRFEEIDVLDMGISFTVHNELEKRSYRATFDWSNPKTLRGEQPLAFTITDNIIHQE